MMGRKTPTWCRIAAIALLLAPATTYAQIADPKTEQEAQAMLESAVEQMQTKQYAAACRKLEAVLRKLPQATGARLELARCYQGEGRTASAWNQYVQVETAARIAGHKERIAEASKAVAELAPLMAKLQLVVAPDVAEIPGITITLDGERQEPKVWGTAIPVDAMEHEIIATAPGRQPWSTRIRVSDQKKGSTQPPTVINVGAPSLSRTSLSIYIPPAVTGVQGVVIKVDGKAIDAAEWANGELVEAGTHDIEVTAPGYEPWAKQVKLSAGEMTTVTLEPLKKLPTAQPEAPPAQSTVRNSPPPPRASNLRSGGIVGITLGSVAVGAGAVLGGLAIQKNGESDDGHCDAKNACDQIGFDLRTTALKLADASTATLIVGGVLLAGGITMVALSPPSKEKAKPHADASANIWIGPGSVGIRGRW